MAAKMKPDFNRSRRHSEYLTPLSTKHELLLRVLSVQQLYQSCICVLKVPVMYMCVRGTSYVYVC